MPPSRPSARTQGGLAAVLALIAGYVDSYGFLNYRVYASFMSGDTTQTGLQAGQRRLAEAGHNLLPIPLFVIGVFLGTLITHSGLRRPLRWLLALVAALLIIDMGAVYVAAADWLSIAILSLAMGMMNSALSRVGGQSISLGYVTGGLNNVGRHLALAAKGAPLADAQGQSDTHGRRAALLGGIWLAFVVGALLAGAATPSFAVRTLLAPALVLLALAASIRFPLAD